MEIDIDDAEIIERYLILLLGSIDRPIPSSEHLQKELFVLSKSNPKIADFIFVMKKLNPFYKNRIIRNKIYLPDKLFSSRGICDVSFLLKYYMFLTYYPIYYYRKFLLPAFTPRANCA